MLILSKNAKQFLLRCCQTMMNNIMVFGNLNICGIFGIFVL